MGNWKILIFLVLISFIPNKSKTQSKDDFRYEVHFTEDDATSYKYRDAFTIRPNPNVSYTFSYWGEEYSLSLPNQEQIHEVLISYKVPEEIRRVSFYGDEHVWFISIDFIHITIRNDSDVNLKFRTIKTFDRNNRWSSWYVVPAHQSKEIGPIESFRSIRHIQSIQIKYSSGDWYWGGAPYVIIGKMDISVR
jgi:hypothetical protein